MNNWNPDKKGEWIPLGHRPGYLKHPFSEDYKCSVCGYEQYTLFMGPPAQCPACGSSMGTERGHIVDRPCPECIWYSKEGCCSWDCEPLTRAEAWERLKIVKCGSCRYWQTGIAYETVGRCTNENMPMGLICNRNFFCGWGTTK